MLPRGVSASLAEHNPLRSVMAVPHCPEFASLATFATNLSCVCCAKHVFVPIASALPNRTLGLVLGGVPSCRRTCPFLGTGEGTNVGGFFGRLL